MNPTQPGYQAEGTHGTQVVGYLRKSSSGKQKQEASIPDQRKAIIHYCEDRGWIIVKWYVDDGKSGSKDQHLRKEFAAMLADAAAPGRQWAGIVVWDTSRFARTDSLDNDAARTLRDAGVFLESTQEGRMDWTTDMGRITWALRSEANHSYSVKLSKATTRGRASYIEQGYWTHGRIPYGYDRLYVREGHEPVRMARGGAAGRPQGYHLKLVKNDGEAALVEWIFGRVLAGKSLRWIAGEMTRQGHATPYGNGRGWMAVTVRQIIQQPAYVGDIAATFSHQHRHNAGKWSNIKAAVNKGVVPKIIDRQTWDRANEILKKKREKGGQTHNGPCKASGLLSGIVKCGHCGYALKKATRKSRVCSSCGADVPRMTKNGKCLACEGEIGETFQTLTYYYCASSMYYPAAGCRCHVVYEGQILPAIRDRLYTCIEAAALQQILSKPPDQPDPDLEEMRTRIAALKTQVAKGSKNLLLVDEDLVAEAQDQLRTWKDELGALEAQVRLAENTTGEAEREQVVGWLEDLKGEWVLLEEEHIEQWRTPWPVNSYRRGSRGQPPPEKVEAPMYMTEDETEDGTVVTVWDDEVSEVHRAELIAHRDALRGLLTRLGVQVAVHWRPAGGPETKLETVDFARISTRFDVSTYPDSYRYQVEGSTSRSTG